MKRPTMLVQAVLYQLALDLDLSVERDQQRIADRCKHEGLSFLTITLPILSDALERGLENETFTCPTQFSRHGKLPRFLGGFFQRVFTKDGRLLPDPCPYTIAGIRQVCRFFKKLKLECSPKREAKAVQHFREVEGELRRMTPQIERKDDYLDKVSGILWTQVFPESDYTDLVCHHGPGFTADSRRPNERYRISKWNQRSEHSFPSDLHCYPNYGEAAESSKGSPDESNGLQYLPIRDEESVKVVFVPKTQSAPRVIAMEPSHVQYMQQSVKDYMYSVLENHPLTRHSVRFTDQSVNQRLAYRSSKNKRLATLDLKDASDRVHLHIVQRIFKNSGLLEYLEDARSLHATLPNNINLVLTKYASMGSALCFPVEACVFYTLILSAMHMLDGQRPSSRSIKRYSRKIDIYGDDIIVPVEYADVVTNYLESYALKVNTHKSFRNSLFRESCGADYFNGVDVKPVYARELPPSGSSKWEASHLMSWCSTADQFYLKGQWHIANKIRGMLRHVVGRPIPRTSIPGPGLAFWSFFVTDGLRFDKDYCGMKQQRLIFNPLKQKDQIDGDANACLNKWGIHTLLRDQRRNPYFDRRWPEQRDSSRLYMASADSCSREEDLRVGPREQLHTLSKLCSLREREEPYGPQIQAMANWDKSEVANWDVATGRKGFLSLRYGTTIDFVTSTKRGGFKSKRRWVSLLS